MFADLFGLVFARLGGVSLLASLSLPLGPSVRRTLIRTYRRLADMGRTIGVSGRTVRVSDEFYEWLESRQRDGESLEETLRRVAGGPHPSEVAGLLTPEEAEEAKAAVKRLRESDGERKRRAREAFSEDE
jgi:predicted CopG family antitoxin